MLTDLFGKVKLAVGAAVVLAVLVGGWYMEHLNARVDELLVENSRLAEGISKQQTIIENLKIDVVAIQRANAELLQLSKQQQQEVDALRKRFREHDLGQLAEAKPQTIQRLVNRGTANAMRCLELATGAKPTAQELAATKLSEINRECPSLANPNYVGALK